MNYPTELALAPPDPSLSEAEVLAALATQVRRLLATERDWLLSKLYRLDVRERDIKAALATETDAATALAGLILARHHERVSARAQFSPVAEEYDPELGDMSW